MGRVQRRGSLAGFGEGDSRSFPGGEWQAGLAAAATSTTSDHLPDRNSTGLWWARTWSRTACWLPIPEASLARVWVGGIRPAPRPGTWIGSATGSAPGIAPQARPRLHARGGTARWSTSCFTVSPVASRARPCPAPRALSRPLFRCAELAGRPRETGVKLCEAESGGRSTQPAARGAGPRGGVAGRGRRAPGRRLGRRASTYPRGEAAPGENGRARRHMQRWARGRPSRIYARRPPSPPCPPRAAASFPRPVTPQDQKLGRLGRGLGSSDSGL